MTASRHPSLRLGTLLPVAITALTIGMSALAYPTMPERMALHWRVGLDGAVRTGTVVSREVGTFFFSPVAVVTLVIGLLAVRQLRGREPTAAAGALLLLVVVLLVLATVQALILGFNAV